MTNEMWQALRDWEKASIPIRYRYLDEQYTYTQDERDAFESLIRALNDVWWVIIEPNENEAREQRRG